MQVKPVIARVSLLAGAPVALSGAPGREHHAVRVAQRHRRRGRNPVRPDDARHRDQPHRAAGAVGTGPELVGAVGVADRLVVTP